MKFYKVVDRPTQLYGSETWVTTTRDMTGLEAADMRFLRSVKGYTRLDKIRSEVVRKELEISGIQDVRSKHKQNWINLERMDNTRLPKHALIYKPRGRRDRGRPRKRWQSVGAGTGQSTEPIEEDDDECRYYPDVFVKSMSLQLQGLRNTTMSRPVCVKRRFLP